MKNKYRSIAYISVFLIASGLLAGCGDEQAAIDQPEKAEELIQPDELRKEEEDARIRREEIQEEKHVIQERIAERQKPEADIPMPTGERKQTVEEVPRHPEGQRELAGADRTAPIALENETMRIDADMIGKQVTSMNGRKLGRVADIFRGVVGDTDYALVESTDKRMYPVPVNFFSSGARSEGLELPFDQVSFKKAPSVQEGEEHKLYDPDFEERIGGFYREQAQTQ